MAGARDSERGGQRLSEDGHKLVPFLFRNQFLTLGVRAGIEGGKEELKNITNVTQTVQTYGRRNLFLRERKKERQNE